MVSYSEVYLRSIAIYNSILFCVCLPFYVYGGIKWYQFQRHFLITKRFPAISNAIILITFFNLIMGVVKRWMEYSTGRPEHITIRNGNDVVFGLLNGISPSFSFLTSGLIVYRVILIYLRWKQSQFKMEIHSKLTNQISNSVSSLESSSHSTQPITVTNALQNKLHKHKISYIWLIYVIIGTIYILISLAFSPNYPIMGMLWIIMVISGICCCSLVVWKKVSEGIGLLFESYISLLYNLFATIFAIIFVTFGNDDRSARYILLAFTPIQGLLPIYISLYLIKKCENNLNFELWQQKFKTELFKKQSSVQNATNLENSDQTTNVSIDVAEKDVVIDLNVPCLVFLNEYKNYKVFAKYLIHCWASENLMFVEKVSVMYWIITQLQAVTVNDEQESLSVPTQKVNRLQRIKFEYSKVYKEYWNKINVLIDNDMEDKNIDHYKNALYVIVKEIYDEFISDDSVHQVNVGAKTRQNLVYLLSEKENTMDKLKTFNDFKICWDDAIIEVYQLLSSVYRFKFKNYVNNLNVYKLL